MYAVVQVGGRQYRARPGERLVVDRLVVAEGDSVELGDVRMLVAEPGDLAETAVGRPRVDGAKVTATAVSHLRGPKVVVFKYKPKKRYRRTKGFRADLTELRVDRVWAPGEQVAEAATPARRRRQGRSTAEGVQPLETASQAPETAGAEAGEAPTAELQAPVLAAPAAKAPRRRRRPVAEATSGSEEGEGDGS